MFDSVLLLMMAAITPTLAGFVLVFSCILSRNGQSGRSLAKIASISALAFGLIASILMYFSQGNPPPSVLSVVPLFSGVKLILLHDRLAVFWLTLNAAVVSQILLFSNLFTTTSKTDNQRIACFVLLFAVSQWTVLLSDGKAQWGLLLLGNWLLCTTLFLSPHKRFPRQLLIWLTIADLFWMLGLMGIFILAGNLHVPFLGQPGSIMLPSDAAAALLSTSIVSMLLSILIRLGMFPFMTAASDLQSAEENLAPLIAFPLCGGGFCLFRWGAVLTTVPEPRTMLIGVAGLSAVLLAVSALFQTGTRKAERLISVLVALIVIGFALNPETWPQSLGCLGGAILLATTLAISHPSGGSRLVVSLVTAMMLILLCGSSGFETIFWSVLNFDSTSAEVQIPRVMLPLLVLATGLFIFGVLTMLTEDSIPSDLHRIPRFGPPFFGCVCLLVLSVSPMFLKPEVSYRLQFPVIMFMIVACCMLLVKTFSATQQLTTPELGALVNLSRQDYDLATLIDRGISLPLEVAAFLTNLFDLFILNGLIKRLSKWGLEEVSESCELIEHELSAGGRAQLIAWTAIVLLISVYLAG